MRVTRGVWNREMLFSGSGGVTLAEGTRCLLDFNKSRLFFKVDAVGDDKSFSVIENGLGLLKTRTWIVFETTY